MVQLFLEFCVEVFGDERVPFFECRLALQEGEALEVISCLVCAFERGETFHVESVEVTLVVGDYPEYGFLENEWEECASELIHKDNVLTRHRRVCILLGELLRERAQVV